MRTNSSWTSSGMIDAFDPHLIVHAKNNYPAAGIRQGDDPCAIRSGFESLTLSSR
jgi:hypothetical protein